MACHEPPLDADRAPRALCVLVAFAVLLQSLWLPYHLASEVHYAPGEVPPVAAEVADLGVRCEDADRPVPHRPHASIEHKQSKQLANSSVPQAPELLPARGPDLDLEVVFAACTRALLPEGRAPPKDLTLAVPCPPRAPPRA